MNEITFSDILIEPQYSTITSRSKIDVSSNLGKLRLNLPVISANMPNITEYKMAVEMAVNGGLGILHRFDSIEKCVHDFCRGISEIKKQIGDNDASIKIGVSIGVKDEDKERFSKLYEAGARLFCIDIAHGHSIMSKNMIEWIRKNSSDSIIIAGNIASAGAALDFAEWGAHIVKVGIGGGSVCRTRSNAGVGKCQFSAIREVAKALNGIVDVGIISDGAIKTAGDVAKALIYVNAVMVGAVLAGTIETPGNVYPEPGTDLTNRRYYKVYGGSASAENKVANGKESRFVEGEMIKVPLKGHAKYLLREIKDGIQSAFSYTGASNLKEYKEKVKWITISSAGKEESKM